MSVPLTVNGVIFNYPGNFDTGWGIDATGWAQAVTAGTLQKAGGSFPLTTEVDFGASFGLKAVYLKTESIHPATSGTVRLSSADAGIVYRNNANSGNLVLTTDASDNLLFNGHVIGSSGGGSVTSITGTANQVIASSPTGNVTLSLPQSIASTSTPTFGGLTLTSSGLLLSSCSLFLENPALQEVIVSIPTSGVTPYNLVFPSNAGSTGQFLQTNGFGATTWVNAAGSGTINSGTQYQLAYYAANGTTLSGDSALTTDASNNLLIHTDGASLIYAGAAATKYIQANGDALYILGNQTPSSTVPDATRYSATIAINDTTTFASIGLYTSTAPNTLATLVASFAHTGSSIATPLDMSSNKITNLTNGTAAQDAAAFGQIPVFRVPTIQSFTTSGTYTTPTSPAPLYIRVKMVGAGGGGAGSGSGGTGGDGMAGGTTTFGSSLLTSFGGGGGIHAGAGGGGGNSNLTGGTLVDNILGSNGQGASVSSSGGGNDSLTGAIGGDTPFGGGARGAYSTFTAGMNAFANTGAGGQSGPTGAGSGLNVSTGGGGGAGGYQEVILSSLLSSYTVIVGGGGLGGTAGTNGFPGGNGGSGLIVVEEYYQ